MHYIALVSATVPANLPRCPFIGQAANDAAWPCIVKHMLRVLTEGLCLFLRGREIEGDSISDLIGDLSVPLCIEVARCRDFLYRFDIC